MKEPLAPVEAFPDREDLSAFTKRAQLHWKKRAQVTELLGYAKGRSKRTPEHFEWLVRYQLNQETFTSIASNSPLPTKPDDKVEPGAVEAAVRSTARYLGLALRRAPRGRPPRQGPATM